MKYFIFSVFLALVVLVSFAQPNPTRTVSMIGGGLSSNEVVAIAASEAAKVGGNTNALSLSDSNKLALAVTNLQTGVTLSGTFTNDGMPLIFGRKTMQISNAVFSSAEGIIFHPVANPLSALRFTPHGDDGMTYRANRHFFYSASGMEFESDASTFGMNAFSPQDSVSNCPFLYDYGAVASPNSSIMLLRDTYHTNIVTLQFNGRNSKQRAFYNDGFERFWTDASVNSGWFIEHGTPTNRMYWKAGDRGPFTIQWIGAWDGTPQSGASSWYQTNAPHMLWTDWGGTNWIVIDSQFRTTFYTNTYFFGSNYFANVYAPHFVTPTNSPTDGQVLLSSGTDGATKWGPMNYSYKPGFSTNYTLDGTYSLTFCTGTNQVITFPNAASFAGRMLSVYCASTTGSVICTNYNGSQTLMGGLAVPVPATNHVTLTSDGYNWW